MSLFLVQAYPTPMMLEKQKLNSIPRRLFSIELLIKMKANDTIVKSRQQLIVNRAMVKSVSNAQSIFSFLNIFRNREAICVDQPKFLLGTPNL